LELGLEVWNLESSAEERGGLRNLGFGAGGGSRRTAQFPNELDQHCRVRRLVDGPVDTERLRLNQQFAVIVGGADDDARLGRGRLELSNDLDAAGPGQNHVHDGNVVPALIEEPDVSLVQVSGTAAIDEQGRSLYPGDVRGQIDCTFDKIAALIGQEGASLNDIAAASVFVKRPEDAPVYQERAAARGLENLPVVIMVADICREELLFEIDAEVAFDSSLRGF
jgi:enamine deaminase RidA (YjgF/YER057c/UK114 family)